jgi:hypothetical protein
MIMKRAVVLLCLAIAGCETPITVDLDDAGMTPETDAGMTMMDTDAGGSTGGGEPGSACDCDDECEGTTANPGLCVGGICMTQASAECSTGGSRTECPAGSRCWGYEGYDVSICWPDCDANDCDGACDSDGSCVPDDASTCTASCSEVCGDPGTGGCPPNSHMEGDGCVCNEGFTVNEARDACVPACTGDTDCSGGDVCVEGRCEEPPCTPTSCPDGTLCAASGDCVIDLGTPPPGPPPACAIGTNGIPDWRCTSGCGEIVAFDPDMGPGYWDYPLNGETAADQYRSYVRRDVMMLVKYATAMVACQSAGWAFGNGGALGLGDMSESDGAIPGTREDDPGHPPGTHVNGHDMDIAYYQTGTGDNRLRAVCAHTSGGADQYHCTGEPTMLDAWRTALFLGHLHISPQVRVIGVDGRVGPLVDSALAQLCDGDWVDTEACTSHAITWEATDTGRGWYHFHHHHLHISISAP